MASLFARTFTKMLMHAMSFGQLLDFIKLRLAKSIDSIIYDTCMSNVNSISEGEEKSRIMYDILCAKSKLMGILDCSFCLGFWVSLFTASYVMYYDYNCLFLASIPITTYLFIEKI